MACASFDVIAAEEAARKLILAGRPDATAEERIAALQARALARSAAANLPIGADGTSDGAKMLLNAVGGNAHRNR